MHGGFSKNGDAKNKDAQVMMGLGRENITGLMPLYLFEEHWAIARRKIAPLFGFMCTLDVMGYTQEQINIVPFLVLLKCIEKVRENPSESNSRMFALVENTCVMMLQQNKVLRKNVAEQVVAFAY